MLVWDGIMKSWERFRGSSSPSGMPPPAPCRPGSRGAPRRRSRPGFEPSNASGASWRGAPTSRSPTTSGYQNRGTVHRIVQKILARHEAELVDELRALELARLDHLQAAFYPAATSGDVKAAEMVLKVMAARCRLLQLDRMTAETSSTPEDHVVVGGTQAEFIEALKLGRRVASSPGTGPWA